MGDALTGPFFAICALLSLGGVAKIRQPEPARSALQGVGLPAAPWLVRLLGLVELLVGGGALAVGGRLPAGLTALLYLGFTLFLIAALRRRDAVRSCGCFGSGHTPPSVAHLLLASVAAVVAALSAVDPGPGVVGSLSGQPLLGLPFLVLTAVCVWFGLLGMTVLADLMTQLERS